MSLLVLEMWAFKLYINIDCRRHKHCHLLIEQQKMTTTTTTGWTRSILVWINFNWHDVRLGWHSFDFQLAWRSTGSMLKTQVNLYLYKWYVSIFDLLHLMIPKIVNIYNRSFHKLQDGFEYQWWLNTRTKCWFIWCRIWLEPLSL